MTPLYRVILAADEFQSVAQVLFELAVTYQRFKLRKNLVISILEILETETAPAMAAAAMASLRRREASSLWLSMLPPSAPSAMVM